jgi:hypothetical protein
MKKLTMAIISIYVISFLGFCGCINQPNNSNDIKITTVNVPLNKIALTQNDVGLIKQAEKHVTEPYEVDNATGNGITWDVIEHYQSFFNENTSNSTTQNNDSLTQSITKLESNNNSQYYLELKKTQLIESLGYEELPMEIIGDKSFYLKKLVTTLEGDSATKYMIVFSVGDVVIVIGGYTDNENSLKDYANIIYGNIVNLS